MRFGRVWLLAAPVAMSGACGACSNGAPDGGPDATPPDVAADTFDAGPPCTPAPRPSYVPTGWVAYDDYAPCSGFYVPTDPSQLPAPITWQACEPAAGVAGCRRINLNWAPLPSPTGTDADAVVDESGQVIVVTSRDYSLTHTATPDYGFSLIAAADGPIYSAIMYTQPGRYLTAAFLPPSFAPPRWILRVTENLQANGGGYIGGNTDAATPTVHHRFSGNAAHSAVVGDLGVLDIASTNLIGLLDFDSGAKLLDIKAPSLPMSFEWMFRYEVYWQGNNNLVDDVGRWTPDAGAIDFINYGFDPNHGAADLGTDGTDMVWFEEFGINDAGAHATMEYWTSPYVTNPVQIVPRRLRSEIPNTNVGTPIAVGCGFAAFASLGLRIVRLSDGWSWYLANVPGWNWQQALTLTCGEVFARIYISGPITTMARVALAQLGPGVPPD